MPMKTTRFGLCSLGVLALAASLAAQAPAAGAQGRGAAPAPQNLQVLPKDTPAADVRTMMTGFAQGLGVQCAYCHVAEGRGGRNDFAADEKPQKNVARLMMRMVMQDNDMIAAGVGKSPADVTKVQCATCHRGAAIPKVEMPPPAPPAAPR
jgi:mono/diheme cytochrome c family protein